MQLSNGGAISGATAAEKCQQASLRIQGWLRFRRLECQHGELLCSTVALYSCDSCAAFVLWRPSDPRFGETYIHRRARGIKAGPMPRLCRIRTVLVRWATKTGSTCCSCRTECVFPHVHSNHTADKNRFPRSRCVAERPS